MLDEAPRFFRGWAHLRHLHCEVFVVLLEVVFLSDVLFVCGWIEEKVLVEQFFVMAVQNMAAHSFAFLRGAFVFVGNCLFTAFITNSQDYEDQEHSMQKIIKAKYTPDTPGLQISDWLAANCTAYRSI